tara:strand:- start:343 stop:567 length:225 start_codon:yes stop_codon:yes gene_type:complete
MDNFAKSTLVLGIITFTLLGYILGFKVGMDKGVDETLTVCYDESIDEDLELLKIERMIDLFFDKAVEFKNATGG